MSIRALDHFAQTDAHARQYSLIGQTLLTTAVEYLERQEIEDRTKRAESSSQLFGLNLGIPREMANRRQQSRSVQRPRATPVGEETDIREARPQDRLAYHDQHGQQGLADVDSTFLGLTESALHTPDANFWFTLPVDEGDVGANLNLFPLLGAGSEIDLANYL